MFIQHLAGIFVSYPCLCFCIRRNAISCWLVVVLRSSRAVSRVTMASLVSLSPKSTLWAILFCFMLLLCASAQGNDVVVAMGASFG